MKRSDRTLPSTGLRLLVAAAMLIAMLVLPSAAMAATWPNEQAMKDEPPGAARDTFIYDPGQHNTIPRSSFVNATLRSYYEGKGFDANFLHWAPTRTIQAGATPWSGCFSGPHPGPCPASLEFHPVNVAVGDGVITVVRWNGAFISRICGNFNQGGGAGPIPRVTGVKYEDLNANGKRDSGEPGLQGWTIKLRYKGKVVASTTTAANGSYSFKLNANQLPVGAGTYRVEEVLKSGWVASQSPGAFTVPLQTEDKTFSGKSFGNYRPAKISGHKFDDSDVDGERDPLEVGLAGWQIDLSNGEDRLTDAEGNYSFSVRPGTYTASELLQEGWRQTLPGGGGTRTYTVISGDVIDDADFGNVCLGGVAISPIDESTGEPVPMEVRIEEVSVPGILENEPSLPRTETGTPTFDELLPGTYRIVAFLPEGVFTTDPDAVPIEGRFAIVKEIVVSECETTDVPIDLFTKSTPGKVTGGVKIDLPDEFATSGFNFMTKPAGPKGTLQYNDHDTGLNLHTSTIEAIWIKGDVAWVWGKVDVDGDLQRFRLRLVDAGEPGTEDRYELTLAGGYEAGFDETLSGGNVQIH